MDIQVTYPGNGANSFSGEVVFDPKQYAEQVGLLLLNGVVHAGWTSHCDISPYTGWLIGYDAATLTQKGVLNLTPNGSEGSIWMSGAGLAADARRNIYFLDANGTFHTTLDHRNRPKASLRSGEIICWISHCPASLRRPTSGHVAKRRSDRLSRAR